MPTPAVTPTPAVPALPPTRAKVLRLDLEGHPLSPGRTEAPAQPEVRESTVVQGRRATRVFEGSESGAESAAPSMPEWIKEFHDNEADQAKAWQAVQERAKGDGGIEKAYIGLTSKLGEQAAQIQALNAQMADMLAAQQTTPADPRTIQPVVAPPDIQAMQAELDAIGASFLEDIPGNVKKMTEISTKLAEAKVSQRISAAEAAQQQEAAEALLAEFPGLFREDPKLRQADAAYVDALASTMGPPTVKTYRKAIELFAKERGYTKPAAGPKDNPDVTAMRESATATAPAGATVKAKGKIFKRSELAYLQIHKPDDYKRMQGEILAAYRDGRVI